jgi:hypothetical protein
VTHKITLSVQDYDSATGQPVGEKTTAAMGLGDTQFRAFDDPWPPCRCLRHFNAQTGEGTHLDPVRLLG